MKKTKLLIGTLALSMGLMGTGYAYWTKQLTVNTTVSSANFDVYFSEAVAKPVGGTGIDNKYNTMTVDLTNSATTYGRHGGGGTGTGGGGTGSGELVKGNGDKVAYTWNNIYPGSQVEFSYTITSTSTIPVKAKPVYTLTKNKDAELAEALKFKVGEETYTGFKAFKAAMEKDTLTLDKTEIGTPVSKTYTVTLILDKDVKDIKTINKSFEFSIDMNWGQFNDATIK